jgi:hypothetical protein
MTFLYLLPFRARTWPIRDEHPCVLDIDMDHTMSLSQTRVSRSFHVMLPKKGILGVFHGHGIKWATCWLVFITLLITASLNIQVD